VPLDVHVHDYHWFCPRIALVGRERRYCGEPELAACAECIADAGSHLEEEIAVSDLVARSAALLGGARRVVAPSADCAGRLRRHFPGLRPTVEPWEDDASLPEPAPTPPPSPHRTRLVCVLGGIGIEKGYEVLLACARDAAARGLPLSFVVVGHTIDDSRLHATGRAFVTGEYAEAEAEALVRAQGADLAFLPSLWPETWSYTLSLAWRAGLPAAVFDLGTPAARVRATGRGWVLPLGLPTASINNALLTAGRLAERGAVSQHRGSGPRLRALPL
jgi:glycosyltransferase involved in cell wall biosynthesis